MSTAVPAWTCPQCHRRVPGREPQCHCGFARANAAGRSVAARPPSPAGPVRRWALPVAALVVGVLGVIVYVVARPRDPSLPAAAPIAHPRIRGEVGYPALPPVPAVKVRRARRAGNAASAAAPNVATRPASGAPAIRPATSVEQAWARAVALVDLPLRKIAADTSVLELSYRPFAEACVDSTSDASRFSRGPARDNDWLGSLKTARLRAGVTLREKGAVVDCETARKSLVALADALKADLAATERLASTNGVLPGQWRTLMATHDLEVWDRY